MARTYKRDSNGRFAGGGGGSGGGRKSAKLPAPAARKVGSKPQRRRGLVTQRAAVKAAKGKLAGKDPADRSIKGTLSRRSQKGAVTKASKALQAAQQSGRVRLSGRGGVLRPGKGGAKKAAPKVDLTLKGIADRRKRANAPRKSMYLSQKMETNSAITRSAANAIYNRQRRTGKALGVDREVLRNPAGIMPGVYGSKKQRASQIREAARNRVVGGRRR